MAGPRPGCPSGSTRTSGIDLEYFAGPDGFAKRMAPMEGEGVVWLFGLAVLPDEAGRERMIAYFHRRRGLGAVLEEGFVAFDDEKEQFVKLKDVPVGPALFPTGYPSRVRRTTGPSTSTSRRPTRRCGSGPTGRATWTSPPTRATPAWCPAPATATRTRPGSTATPTGSSSGGGSGTRRR